MTTPIPRWGRVVARPNEFLIQIRSGRVVRAGQGLSCFKWPWDSVAVLSTAVEKLSFVADQVTLEKVGVQVSGLAVYRIADPLLAYRMVNGTQPDALSEILRDMFVGATRRIVASLSLEHCLTHRKERVAAELMREIAPVLAGQGMEEDSTHQGWGVVLDTIEIQDVRVLSEEVFARLQAPYRAGLLLAALRAQEDVDRQNALIGEARARVEAKLRAEEQEASLARDQARVEAERTRLDIELESKRRSAELEIELARTRRTAMGDLSPARLEEILLTETMPKMAHAFRGTFGTVHLTQVSGGTPGAELVSTISAGIRQVIEATRRPT